jgi:hypothetical protein
MMKKIVVLEAYVQTSYEQYAHEYMSVEIDVPDDEYHDWHVAGEMIENG